MSLVTCAQYSNRKEPWVRRFGYGIDQKTGQLVIISGAKDKKGDCKILREFVRCAGGTEARVVVLTVATDLPGEVGEDYIQVFERIGVEAVHIIDTAHRQDADNSENLKIIEEL